MKKIIFLPFLAFLAGGCLLPSGTPPEGKIVSNPEYRTAEYAETPKDAAEMVIPELTAVLLQDNSGKTVFIDAEKKLYPAARYALLECGKLTGHKAGSAQAPRRLQLRAKGNAWQWKFYQNKREVWSKTVLLH